MTGWEMQNAPLNTLNKSRPRSFPFHSPDPYPSSELDPPSSAILFLGLSKELMAISSSIAAYSAINFTNSSPSPPPPPPTPSPFSNVSIASKKSSARPEQIQHREMVFLTSAVGRFGSLRGGGALLERPTFDQTQFDPLPLLEEGGDIGRLSDRKGLGSGDSFKVLLIDDPRHTEKLVEKGLPQVVPSITVDDARKLFHESRDKGVAVVIVTVKEHAEFYAQMMLQRGLRSAIEPDSNSAV